MKNRFESTVLCASEIERHLAKSRNGRIIVLESTDSTNTNMKRMVAEGSAKAGDCIIANVQTSGRGRLGRSFFSESDKGIYYSYLLDLSGANVSDFPQITARAAVAVRDALYETCGVSAQIKWVNDLVYGGKKLCGILSEMSFSGNVDKNAFAIIGIGINVNHEVGDFPDEISDIATSLRAICGKTADRARICAALTEKLDKLSGDFPENKEYYLSQYRENCAVLGKKVRIIKGDTERTGTAFGISENFGLIIDFDDGTRSTVTDGEVSVRGFYGYI